MCASDVFLIGKDGECRLLMEMVDILRPEKGGIYLRNTVGEEKHISARIREIRLVDHSIVLEAERQVG